MTKNDKKMQGVCPGILLTANVYLTLVLRNLLDIVASVNVKLLSNVALLSLVKTLLMSGCTAQQITSTGIAAQIVAEVKAQIGVGK